MFGRACTRTWTSQRLPHSPSFSKLSLGSKSRSTPQAQLHLDSRARPTAKYAWRSASITTPQFCRRYSQKNDFESLGIFPPLASNLENLMMISEPTVLQNNFIPPILAGKDVLIRDTTGSGKTFGILLSLLSKPRRRIGPDRQPGITSVIVVPNQELAFQLQSWARSLLPAANNQQMQEMVQVVVTPTLPIPSISAPTTDSYDTTKGRKYPRRRIRDSILTPTDSMIVDNQVEILAKTLPHVLIATPSRLWSLVQRGILDLSGIETLVLDEVDSLIRLPKRFASQKEIENRDRHPKPAELVVREIIRSARAIGRNRTSKSKAYEEGSKDLSDRIQVIAASATMNRPMRYWLESNSWVQDPEWVDTTKSVVLPDGIEHHCLVIGAQSIRNMKLESDRTPWNERGDFNEIDDAKNTVEGEPRSSNEEVDWDEKDRAWKKDKDMAWKASQLDAPGVELDNEVEKFRDDDDRILEGVATACMLDKVENACVFFCSSFSLGDLATRLEADFGLEVQQIQNAFEGNHGKEHEERAVGHIHTKKNSRKGIYIAHENNARGLDLPGLSHVYIVGLPSAPSSYIHMAGRTGRMGKKGQVVTIIRDDGHLEDRARSMFRTLNVEIQPFRHVE
ncbi:hypothetical protein BGX27_004068 [Mortierella sp. AM989]|nr:hypothetical protein BGX27_004068 [Mortierella sp. AM989]